jgi:RimJ/RimL family protein N-acetyltransferase
VVPLCIFLHLPSHLQLNKTFHRMPDISTSIENTKLILSNRIPTPEKPYVEVYAILLKLLIDGDRKAKMIGTVGAPRNEPVGVEIGYGLHPDYWEKWYMSEALKLFIEIYWCPGSASLFSSVIQ